MPTVWFVGVSTASSLVHDAVAFWGPLLGVDVVIEGRDLPVDAARDDYRRLVADLARDDTAAGAVVTTHKVALLGAARHLLAGIDEVADSCGEVNALRRSSAGLVGFARDPVSVGRVVDRIWPADAGNVLCLGAGGTAVALARHVSTTRPDVRIAYTDTRQAALDHLAAVVGDRVERHLGPGPWDHLVEVAPPGSLIVNATGMGKDRPGSPLSPETSFPRRAVVWELNYRGQLSFLRHAQGQAIDRDLLVHDGWQLFCHGWAAALAAVLDVPDDPELGERFVVAAAAIRPDR